MTESQFYRLEGRLPVPCDVITWVQNFATGDRIVGDTKIDDDVHISTVFIGVDMWSLCEEGPPKIFETMVRGGRCNGWKWRSATWEEAAKRHACVVQEFKAEQN